tara:strand:+ start:1636 stop:1776 length:141 start_codon:yes stop_codon:yes gene_type:complete
LIEIDEIDFIEDGWKEINGQMKRAYLSIIITQNEIIRNGYNPRTMN